MGGGGGGGGGACMRHPYLQAFWNSAISRNRPKIAEFSLNRGILTLDKYNLKTLAVVKR